VVYQNNSYNGLSLNNTAVLDGFTITGGNASASNAPHCDGGGMYNQGCSPTVTNCTFSGNLAESYGGGVYDNSCSPTFTNCVFSGDSATTGAGMCNDAGSSSTVTNCLFSGNAASNDGGGLCNAGGSPSITNCTFSGNLAASQGGGIYNNSSATVTNCILWGDSANTAAEVCNDTLIATFSYSDVAGCGGSGAGWNSSIGTDSGANIAADPTFVSPVAAFFSPTTTGDYRLRAGSPCIDAGNNAAVPSGVTTDLDGNPRIVGPAVDMGAYEFQGTCNLAVQSAPPTGLSIGSSRGNAGTTDYTDTVGYDASVNLQAPATDPLGYTFSQWTVNSAAQTAGQKSITFTVPTNMVAVAQYTANSYTLNVQSTPPTGVVITSTSGNGGATNYAGTAVYATSVNLAAPATDPTGYTFSQWTVNGAAQAAGQKSITFPMTAGATAVAQYTLNTYTLTVQSTPPTGLSIGSSTGNDGTTSYTNTVGYGISVDLQAPATDPTGYTFSCWTLNGTPQPAGEKEITPTMPAMAMTAVAVYTVNTYALTVQSTPPTGVVITSTSGNSGTTNYAVSSIAYNTSVNLAAPATDPTGYTFSQWTVNGAAQTAGQKSITFPMSAGTTAVAQYTANPYTLNVQSTPPTGIVVTSSGADGGATNYTVTGVGYGTSVNLATPATDPTGYTFSQWTVNGAAQTAGQKSITFPMTAGATAVAQYTLNTYALTVQSTPVTGLRIGSSTGDGGATNYTVSSVSYGASVNLAAPATDPAGYVFSQWTVNGAAQTAGQKAITFTMPAAATAVAQYAPVYALSVQSMPPTGIVITSGSADGGTTNYTVPGVASGASVNLAAPATDPAGYVFSQWTVNGAAQTAGQKSITFTMIAAATAVAEYTPTYTLAVQSTPPTGLGIASSTGNNGTTNYADTVVYGTSVNLQAPATDPGGYTFSQWTVNGAAQSPGQKSVTFTLNAAVTAVAQYTSNMSYALTVESTPPTGLSIGSSTGQGGTTKCTIPGVGYGTAVNLQAPATDPGGYSFSQWTVNGAAQSPGQKSVTFTMDAAVTAVAKYTPNTGYTLSMQSTPPTGLSIGSSTGHSGTTNCAMSGVCNGTCVNVAAPDADPAGYTFSRWTVNGAAQGPGQKSVTFTMDAAVTAVAHYTANISYTLTVQSTPVGKQAIGSSTGQGGTTSYTKTGIAYGTSVNLAAPATDPAGYTFSQWTLNGAAQPDGQKSITFTIDAAVTAVAEYTANTGYTLTVQSTPPGKQVVTSSTFDGGITNYTVPGVAYGTSVNVAAPATDPAGYTFSQWTVNGAAQAPGQKSVTFTMDGAVTAVAEYTANIGYTLTVDSTPPAKQVITSSTGQNGTTNYAKSGVGNGTSVNLQAPAADPAGYTFSQWTVNGAAQTPGQKSVTFTMDGAVTAVAEYTSNIGYALTVDSTPPTGLVISSSTGQNGTTNYVKAGVGNGTSVNLQAPATDPAGYTFSQWTVNGAAQTAGEKSITFTMDGGMTAVAQYTLNGYALTVESTPPAGLSIGSSTGQKGTTNYYTNKSVGNGTSVNLQAPATDPAGYTFSQWTLNGVAQTAGEKSITFTMDGGMTAVAQYTLNGYTLTVQSTPPAGQGIGSSTGQSGTTNYTITGIGDGASVNLAAPATDPAGYTFSQWTLNGAAQPDGQKSITFTMDAAVTAAAHYTANISYTLTVQSTPAGKQAIGSSTGNSGTTNYANTVAYGTTVNLAAPATDPAGYTFSQWTLNGAAQPDGQKSITFTMDAAVTALAHYTANVGYTLTVQSTPPGKQVVTSSTFDGGITNYTVPGVAYGTSVNVAAPATDPGGYTFSQWTVNGAAQAPGQKSVTFTMDGAVTAVAEYTANIGYTLTVDSTPPTGLVISSSTGRNGTTNYVKGGVGNGTSVNLQAPATDPAGYTFSQWTVNGAGQSPGQKSVTFTMDGAVTAVAQYTANMGYTLSVQATTPGKQVIGSSTGHGGTTNYTKAGVAYGTSVNVQAPATDPAGYTFSQWTVDGAAQTPGQKSVTFTISAAVTAVAQYTANVGYALTVQSTPPVKQVIGSSTGHGGTTNYTKTGVAYGTSVNLQAPATDPAGYTFLQWTVNGAAQPDGQKSITLTMDAAVTAVAHYTSNIGYALTVQSTPPVKQVISSSTGHGGTTNYTRTGVAYGTSVNLQAPATDPAGYTFSHWTVSGAVQPAAQKSVTFTMTAAITASAVYIKDVP
jgi:hypothetical protein